MSAWGTVTWDVARAGGFTAYILVALSVALGLALTLRWQSARWPRLINSEMHNFVTLLSLVFTVVHIAAVWIDPFTRFGWKEVFIPFLSHYRPLWMSLGIVAFYLGLAIGLSTWLRPKIGYAWWRRLHVLTIGIFALVTVHGIATGSDTRTGWGMAIYAIAVAIVAGQLLLRFLTPAAAQMRAHPGLALATVALVLAGTVWTMVGPLQPGWNALANNGNGSGARVALAAAQGSSGASGAQAPSTSTANDPFAKGFTANITGTMRQRGDDGRVIIIMDGTLSGGAQGSLQVQMRGYGGGDDEGGSSGSVTITSTSVALANSSNILYRGQLTSLNTGNSWQMNAVLSSTQTSGQSLSLAMNVTIDSSGTMSGTVQSQPSSGSPAGGAVSGSSSN